MSPKVDWESALRSVKVGVVDGGRLSSHASASMVMEVLGWKTVMSMWSMEAEEGVSSWIVPWVIKEAARAWRVGRAARIVKVSIE